MLCLLPSGRHDTWYVMRGVYGGELKGSPQEVYDFLQSNGEQPTHWCVCSRTCIMFKRLISSM
jgi:hypothetical protein